MNDKMNPEHSLDMLLNLNEKASLLRQEITAKERELLQLSESIQDLRAQVLYGNTKKAPVVAVQDVAAPPWTPVTPPKPTKKEIVDLAGEVAGTVSIDDFVRDYVTANNSMQRPMLSDTWVALPEDQRAKRLASPRALSNEMRAFFRLNPNKCFTYKVLQVALGRSFTTVRATVWRLHANRVVEQIEAYLTATTAQKVKAYRLRADQPQTTVTNDQITTETKPKEKYSEEKLAEMSKQLRALFAALKYKPSTMLDMYTHPANPEFSRTGLYAVLGWMEKRGEVGYEKRRINNANVPTRHYYLIAPPVSAEAQG